MALNAPGIAGQSESYLRRQLWEFKNGQRGNHEGDTAGAQMRPMAATLADSQAIADVSAYIGRSYQGRVVESDVVLAELLIDHARAAVVPGSVFEAPYAIRFSYACSEDDIRAGVGRVVELMRSLEPVAV